MSVTFPRAPEFSETSVPVKSPAVAVAVSVDAPALLEIFELVKPSVAPPRVPESLEPLEPAKSLVVLPRVPPIGLVGPPVKPLVAFPRVSPGVLVGHCEHVKQIYKLT